MTHFIPRKNTEKNVFSFIQEFFPLAIEFHYRVKKQT